MDHLTSMRHAILEMIATGQPLHEILKKTCLLVEAQATPGLCSIMVLDEDGTCLHTSAAPSLAPEAAEALDGLALANLSGSCGTAPFNGEMVVVEDTSCDPRWAAQGLHDFANRFGLKAYWSRPFFSKEGGVLGAVTLSQLEPGAPSADDLKLLETAAHLTSIAVERAVTDATLREALVKLTQRGNDLNNELTERRQLEAQLLQAQKMEAIGLLAGGVAHDLNNILTIINGYCDLLLSRRASEEQSQHWLEEIRRSGDRGAALTNGLLAFAQKQVLSPAVLNLNEVARQMESLLSRTLGEGIEVEIVTDPDAGSVEADRAQLEKAIVNLCLNARDAMPTSGRLIVEVRQAEIRAPEGLPHNDLQPGRYVTLSIRDSGHGMEPDVLSRVFEPFFTTKKFGKGSGLGLSTAYGIARQSGGGLVAESEPGVGSTLTIYLPEAGGAETTAQPVQDSDAPGEATLLLVDDDDAARTLLVGVLRKGGYRVLDAESGPAALDLLDGLDAEIDLLVTDVVMPGMSGPELALNVAAKLGPLPTMFVSGYANDVTDRHGLLDPSTVLLQKPVAPEVFLGKVGELLAARVGEASTTT